MIKQVAALDTSVIVAAVLGWHEAHRPCADTVTRVLQQEAVLPQSALIEGYSVLTRLPAPHRLRPEDALQVLEGSFRNRARIGALRSTATWGLLSHARHDGITGGLVCDARILSEALTAGAGVLFTLNARHFGRLADDRILVVDPSAAP